MVVQCGGRSGHRGQNGDGRGMNPQVAAAGAHNETKLRPGGTFAAAAAVVAVVATVLAAVATPQQIGDRHQPPASGPRSRERSGRQQGVHWVWSCREREQRTETLD